MISSGFHAYDHIELPEIRPVVPAFTGIAAPARIAVARFSASPPAGMPPGSPFGPDLTALIVHLHVTQAQAINPEQLAQLLDEVFGIRIGRRAIANLIARAQTPLTASSAATIAAEVRASPVVASDETSARVRAITGGNGCCCRRPPSTI